MKDWDWDKARHLLARAGFGGNSAEIAAFAKLGAEGAVSALFADPVPALSKPDWLAEAMQMRPRDMRGDPEKRKELQHRSREYVSRLKAAWLTDMVESRSPSQMFSYRMIWFWHGHFATSSRKVKAAPFIYQQLALFYRNGRGNYADLLHGIVRDPAMLRYLDNVQNRRGAPNENLARELMELFSLGSGAYSEEDIRQGARALTGWGVKPWSFRLAPFMHDPGRKTILGQSGHFDGDDFVDLILKQPACATFMVTKLWRYFAESEPSAKLVGSLAESFRAHRYQLEPLLREIFLHPAFYGAAAVGQQIKSPVQLVVGTARLLGMEAKDGVALVRATRLMGQEPYLPPNVKGWPGGRQWINTSTLLVRASFAEMIARGQRSMRSMVRGARSDGDEIDGDAILPGELSAEEAVHGAARLLLAVPLAQPTRRMLCQQYAANRNAAKAKSELIGALLRLPEFQLC